MTRTINASIRRLTRKNRRQGQGMTEYIIIVGLVAIVLIKAVDLLSQKLNAGYEKAHTKIESDVTGKM